MFSYVPVVQQVAPDNVPLRNGIALKTLGKKLCSYFSIVKNCQKCLYKMIDCSVILSIYKASKWSV